MKGRMLGQDSLGAEAFGAGGGDMASRGLNRRTKAPDAGQFIRYAALALLELHQATEQPAGTGAASFHRTLAAAPFSAWLTTVPGIGRTSRCSIGPRR
ncbi:hypothetical protein [Paenibacillus ginsengihumi]|uniref:hypothetical protein n=1 Tax=Paenibacillus ginsengihumi TaxID=431596 RepID=UPI00036437BD|nr:hypothetical protein [Paenibacillus ginsengihumi]